MNQAIRPDEFIPRAFAVSSDDSSVPTVIAWGFTLPDGSVIAVDWHNGTSSAIAVCRNADTAAWLHGGELNWFDTVADHEQLSTSEDATPNERTTL